MQDKAPSIRGMTEKVIIQVLPHTGPSPFKKLVKDLKPAVQNTIKPIINKCISEADLGDNDMEDVSTKPAPSKKQEEDEKESVDSKPLPAALAKARDPKNKNTKARPKTAVPMTAEKIHERLRKKQGGATKKKGGEEDTGLVILDVGRKEKRNDADKKKRWHPEEIRGDYIEKFKNSTKSVFGEAFTTKMFGSDFKQHKK